MNNDNILLNNQDPVAMEKMKLCHLPLSFDSITDKQWDEAMWATAQHITFKLHGNNPRSGPFSEAVLGIPAVDFFSLLAFDVLFTKQWKLKPDFTLKSQMKKAADGLMSNHKKHYDKNPMPIMESFDDYRETLIDTLRDEDDSLEVTYERAQAAVKDDKELLEFLDVMPQCNTYEEISSDLEIPMKEVYNRQRRLVRRLKKK